jgi:prepilin-type N-terminal cleavage/methylation domain-containing protein/prepilin-type processing-associated H-X9-DG protein
MPARANCNRGLTLTELLVVIAIVGLLLALALPAIMRAREAAHRTQCQNHIRQLGVALIKHHDSHMLFPAGTDNEWSWIARLLPYLEESNLHARLDFDFEPFEAPNQGSTSTLIPLFLCPSDANGAVVHAPPSMPGFRFAHTNYLGSLDANDDERRGMFGEYFGVRLREVRDGTSSTIFVGERCVVVAGGESYGWWAWGPETIVSAGNGFHDGHPDEQESASHWWSQHPGGANFLFVDGSVHFLDYGIDPVAFVGLGTKDGGEIVEGF